MPDPAAPGAAPRFTHLIQHLQRLDDLVAADAFPPGAKARAVDAIQLVIDGLLAQAGVLPSLMNRP
jgi:hypothetical protein